MRILDRLRVSLLGSVPHKEIWQANFRPLVEWISPFWGKNSIKYYKTISPKRFRDFFRTLLYAFLIIVSWKNHIPMRLRHLRPCAALLATVYPWILALPDFIGYWYILSGRLITWSGIVTYLYAAQRDLRGKSPSALSSLCGLRAAFCAAWLFGYR